MEELAGVEVVSCCSLPLPPTGPQTVVGVVLFGVLYWLVKKLGKPTAEYLDERSAVSHTPSP